MQFGIDQKDINYIIDTIETFPEVQKALIFGSRSMGNYKKGSDIDIALIGNQVNFSTIAKIKDLLQEESPMPYLFDIVDYSHCQSEDLKAHIKQYGIVLYERSPK